MKVILSDIQGNGPCGNGWGKLLNSRKGATPDDVFPVSEIILSNGITDALWVIDTLCGEDGKRVCHEFALECAEAVEHLMEDTRSVKALEAKRLWLDGALSDGDLIAAWSAAVKAATAAGINSAKGEAAWAAARAASVVTAWGNTVAAARAASYAVGNYYSEKEHQIKLLKIVRQFGDQTEDVIDITLSATPPELEEVFVPSAMPEAPVAPAPRRAPVASPAKPAPETPEPVSVAAMASLIAQAGEPQAAPEAPAADSAEKPTDAPQAAGGRVRKFRF